MVSYEESVTDYLEMVWEICQSYFMRTSVELNEDRSLFARMLVVCKSRPDINVKESIGKHE